MVYVFWNKRVCSLKWYTHWQNMCAQIIFFFTMKACLYVPRNQKVTDEVYIYRITTNSARKWKDVVWCFVKNKQTTTEPIKQTKNQRLTIICIILLAGRSYFMKVSTNSVLSLTMVTRTVTCSSFSKRRIVAKTWNTWLGRSRRGAIIIYVLQQHNTPIQFWRSIPGWLVFIIVTNEGSAHKAYVTIIVLFFLLFFCANVYKYWTLNKHEVKV